MHWSTICPKLVDVFTALALPYGAEPPDGWKANWRERRDAGGFMSPSVKFSLDLKITSCVGDGHDGTAYDYEDGKLYERQFGQRRFTLQLQAHVLEHQDDLFAMEALERIRTRIRRPSVQADLKTVNVGLIDVLAATKATVTLDKRRVSAGIMDVLFAAAVNDTDPSPVGWFERAIVSSELRGADDELLPSPPNFTDLVVPPDPE